MSDGAVTAPRRTPSVSEIQAALQAAREGLFAAAGAPSGDRLPAATEAQAPVLHRRAAVPAAPLSGTAGQSTVGLMSVHGGAGARTLAAVLPGTHYIGGGWPTDWPRPVLLVCRSNYRGYAAAQEFARAYRDDEALRACVELAGVVVVADCPGRMPAPLRRLERLVSGALPVVGHVPWMPEWRLGPPDPAALAPEWVSKLTAAVAAAQ
ncbi:hypothetical protein SAMN05892883_2249 [Jatrophihabitans sp. GAS493]|uniref:DUF6668 family protein n=1 Tax=Jatrophihabitans sp. GAS493 TaxID=1907575 RepID=UPI000BBFC630|nr:DUF6668 family protein [Jatrophihabitans sp. GAS493]SOD72936.1 hypothetical protein SAMN05892883_2249 [Jatrophihabitans sp. GAS493]